MQFAENILKEYRFSEMFCALPYLVLSSLNLKSDSTKILSRSTKDILGRHDLWMYSHSSYRLALVPEFYINDKHFIHVRHH